MTSVFIPPKDKFPVNSCSEPCKPPFVPTPLCPPLCDPYTFGPFTAPTTLYTYYNYPNTSEDFTLGCKDGCSNKHVNTELKYSVYQIIDDVEHFVGYWTIKDKEGPNKRKFEECGEYILRFCSTPPNQCYPECVHPEVPQIHVNDCNLFCDPYIASSIGDSNPDFEPFNQFLINVPKCCGVCVTVTFESDKVNKFDLPSNGSGYQFDSGKFCENIKDIVFDGSEKCIEKLHVIVKRGTC